MSASVNPDASNCLNRFGLLGVLLAELPHNTLNVVYGVLQGVLQKDNRDLAIMLDGDGDAVPMAVITV